MSSRASKSPVKKGGTARNGNNAASAPIELSDSSDDGIVVASTSRATTSKPPSKSSTKVAASTTSNGKRKANAVAESDSESDDVKPAKKRASLGGRAKPAASRKATKKVADSEDDEEDYKDNGAMDEEEDVVSDDDDEDEEDAKPVKKTPKAAAAPAAKKPASKPSTVTKKASPAKAKQEPSEETDAKPKYKWQPKQSAGPSNPGSKPIPDGAPDALGGLTIVFTGELESIGRDESVSLAKKYGAKVTTSVSSKTSYVVVGADAGPSKLKMIEKNGIKTLDEDGFLNLIATRGSNDLDEKYLKKQKEEDKKIRETAKEMASASKAIDPHALWTVKYAPKNLKELCGNTGQIEKLRVWLESWQKNAKSGFKKPGKDGWGIFRAAMLSGPPGIGKTTTAHLVAELCGYKVIEMNASDTRNKKLLETLLRSTLDNTVLDGFLSGNVKDKAVEMSDRSCLIMDEVDGTSGGDRGGIGALNALIKKTKVPIICIANDRGLPKMKPLLATTFDLKFRRPDANMIRSRLMSIAFREGIKIDKTVADQLVAGTQSDIRQIINILATWKLSSNVLTYNETKALTETRDSDALATPFALMDKLFSPYAWSSTANARITEKLEVYFHDFGMMPMFVQENYLKHRYSRASSDRAPEWKKMQLTSQAADAISDGDLVDRMIHGTQQHWSLLPTHGMLSTVMPSYYCYGAGSFGGFNSSGPNSRAFPAWFGKNSTQGRLSRALTDIQIHMRLKVSGDKQEIRKSYIPNLMHKLVMPLVENGADGIADVIQEMDEYYLSKDEWDAIVELGIGDNAGEPILKKIPATTKSAFTRKYNTSDHPIPFHKATDITQSKRMAAAEKPDLEEAFEQDVEPEPEEDEKKPKKEGEEDTIKDKLVKAKKPKGAGKAAATKAAPKEKAAPAKAVPKAKK